MVCHSRAANWVLGLTTLQMNRDHDYGGIRDNQLRTLEHLGVFRVSEAAHIDEIKDRVRRFRVTVGHGLSDSLGKLGTLPAPGLVADVRGLLAAPLASVEKEAYRPLDWVEERLRSTAATRRCCRRRRRNTADWPTPPTPGRIWKRRAQSYLHANCASVTSRRAAATP